MLCALSCVTLVDLGCTEYRDGRVELDLAYPCRPGPAELQARIGLYCLRVTRGATLVAGPACASSLEEAALSLPESISPVRIGLEILDRDGVPLLRGISPETSLLSGEEDRVPLALAPVQGFGLLAGQAPGCASLPHPLEGHTASAFPSGHLLLLGSSRSEVTPTRAGLLFDGHTHAAVTLATPASLHRNQHTSSPLGDGGLLVAGGVLTADGQPTRTLVSLAGGSALGETYLDGWDYAPAVNLTELSTGLLHPRPAPDASVFFGSQVLLVDGLNPPEMFLASLGTIQEVEFTNLPGSPFPPNNRTARVVPYAPDKALVPGLGTGRLGRLTVQEGSARALFDVVVQQTAARNHPMAVLLEGERVLVLGGVVSGSVQEGPVVVWGNDGSLTEVPVPPGFPERAFSASLLPDGRVLVAGGVDPGTTSASPRSYLLSPVGAGFRVERGPDLQIPRAGHTASLLPDGRLALAGGAGLSLAQEDPAWSVEVLAVGRP
jgi:hypothetical protein